MAIHVTTVETPGGLTLSVKGEVDLYSSPDLRKAIQTALKGENPSIQVNLADVEYMDSSGVATLVEGFREARKQERAFILLTPSTPVLKVLQLSRLDQVFDIRQAGGGPV